MYRIIAKEELAPGIKLFKILAPEIAKKVKLGHFVIIRVNKTGERIPLTVNDFDRERGLLTIVSQEVGKTTKLLGTLKVGDGLLGVMGPCGKPSEIENFGRVICVGGGVGMAVIYPIARALAEAGNKAFGIIGAKNKELLIFEREMKEICHKLYIATDDGSRGGKGFVTEVLKKVLKVEHTIKEVTTFGHIGRDGKFVSFAGGIHDGEKIDRVIAIGPAVMMKFVSEITKKLNFPIKTIVRLI